MKRLLVLSSILSLVLFCPLEAREADKNTLRVGTGINIQGADESYRKSGFAVGPSLYAEYDRAFSNYFSLSANLHWDGCNYGLLKDLSDVSVGLRAMFRPFPKGFRYLELGVGTTAEYRYQIMSRVSNYTSGMGKPMWSISHSRGNYAVWGFDVPIRLYLIDNEVFDLSISYAFKFNVDFRSGFDAWLRYSNVSVLFGVKF